MIGLKRHTVMIVDHDPDWIRLAFDACQAVRSACGDLLADVQHVGSTAVPDLQAKPILDLVAAVATFDSVPALIPRLADLGYSYRRYDKDARGHLFVLDSSPDVRLIHLHVVEHTGKQWRNYLFFRDTLRTRPAIRKEYAHLKRNLADTYPDDRESYTASKSAFIRKVLESNGPD
jgi:GrpB-like predicted nucleotidyltransferase (UPF0157 family)